MTYMGDYLETGIEIGEEFVVLLTPQGVGLLRDKPPKPITGKGIQCISTALDPLGFDSTTHPHGFHERERVPARCRLCHQHRRRRAVEVVLNSSACAKKYY